MRSVETPSEHVGEQSVGVLEKKEKLMQFVLQPGMAWNPLANWPRNKPCFCNSKKKAKKCCLPKVTRVIPSKDVADVKKRMSLGGVK